MSNSDTASDWASKFGLALSPLLEPHETTLGGEHSVLLDGGYGSFVLSVSPERLWSGYRTAADWSWSSNLPHHVTLTDREVAVVRWDKRREETFTRDSVERRSEAFYEYLTADQVKSNQGVVEHILEVFRSMRSLLAGSQVDDDLSVDAFLALLGRAMVGRQGISPPEQTDFSLGENALRSLPKGQVDQLVEVLQSPNFAGLTANLALAVRHAGSEIFQEAHFELLRAHGADMFGYAQPAESARVTRGGAHFTPAALARTVVEQVLRCLPDLRTRQTLTVLDPACGSGVFLHEALRTLRRLGYEGRVCLVGRDTSKPAISMAHFVLRNALSDWSPRGGHKIDVLQADSLISPLPSADVILMNPPFISWLALGTEQRDHMQGVLGELSKGRGDYSMAFITRTIDVLSTGGVMGTLLPSSLLALDAASKWRRDLLDKAEVKFMAALGEYGLFPYAQVQVAMAVLTKEPTVHHSSDAVSILVTDNDHHATGNALRALRKADINRDVHLDDKGWQLFQVPSKELRERPTWRLVPQRTELAISRLLEAGDALPAGDLFNIHQGIRTGSNSVFLLSEAQLEALPKEERMWFRPAITNKAITKGIIRPERFVFYPYGEHGLSVDSEEQLIRDLPEYFQTYLEPSRASLLQRRSLRGRHDWWGLSWPRAWSLSSEPRIISKFFGGVGGFALDREAEYVVVQGYAWFPKWKTPSSVSKLHEGEPTKNLLAAYVTIMNSSPFQRLLRVFSPHVAGGQFDLSPKYVKHVPLPNIPVLMSDERAGRAVSTLAELRHDASPGNSETAEVADRLTTQLYGPAALEHL